MTVFIVASDKYTELVEQNKVHYAQAADVMEVSDAKEAKVVVEITWSEERIKEEVWRAAAKYNTFPEKMWRVMLCENDTLDPTRQSHHIYSFSDPSRGIYKGEREKSYGLAQIHLPDHDVSYEEATDPEFAIDFMAKNFAEGQASWWTCYDMIYNNL